MAGDITLVTDSKVTRVRWSPALLAIIMETFDGSLEEAQPPVISKALDTLNQFSDTPKFRVVPSIGFNHEFGRFPESDLGLKISNDESEGLSMEAIGRVPN